MQSTSKAKTTMVTIYNHQLPPHQIPTNFFFKIAILGHFDEENGKRIAHV
jgi:hypothetical protein